MAVARADRLPGSHRAEVAVAVDDALRHEGIGTGLLERLVHFASPDGIRVSEADILGSPVRSHAERGVVHATLPITPTDEYAVACRRRRSTLDFDAEATNVGA